MNEIKHTEKILPVLVVTYGGLFTLGLIDNLRGPLFPSILSHFSINSQTGALLFVPSSLAALITTLLSPWWLNFFGAKRSMYLSLAFMGIGSLIFGLVSLNGNIFWPMAIGAVAFGIGNGFCSLCINLLLGQVAPPAYRRQLFSGMHAMYGMASLCAPLVATLFGPKLWPYAFLVASAPALVFLLIALSTFQQIARQVQPPQHSKTTLPFFAGLFYPGAMLAFYVCAEVLLSTRLSQYLEHGLHWSYHKATTYNFIFFMCLTAGRLLTAFLPLKLHNSTMLLVSLVTSIAGFSLGFRYPVAFLMTGFFMSYFYPLTMDTATERFQENASAYITKAIIIGGIFLPSMHYLVGMATDYWGITMSLLPGPIFLIIALIILVKYEFIGKLKGSS